VDAYGLEPRRQTAVAHPSGLGSRERAVERSGRGVLARLLPGLDGELLDDLGAGDALVLERDSQAEHVVVDDLRASAVVALGRCGDLAFEGLLLVGPGP
jgi:hypothetical protein